eukprot:5607764-Amphidinium_carterae.2
MAKTVPAHARRCFGCNPFENFPVCAQAYNAESLAIRTLAPSCNLADSREQGALLQQVDASHKTVHKARRRPMHAWLWDNLVVARQ